MPNNLSAASLRTGSQRERKKNSAIESVIPWAKRVEAWIRERNEWESARATYVITRPLSARPAHPSLHSASSL